MAAQADQSQLSGKLPSGWELPEAIRRRFGEGAGKQRVMCAAGHLLVVLHAIPEKGRVVRRGVFFWRAPDGTWNYSGRGHGIKHLRQHVKDFEEAVKRLEGEYHQAQSAQGYFSLLERATPLFRTIGHMYETLQAAREAASDDHELISIRDAAGDVVRAAELLLTDTKNALDFTIASQSEEAARLSLQTAQAGNRLNVLAAMFFPLTALASIFAMNFRSGLEGLSVLGFWVILALGIALGVIVYQLVVKAKP